MSLKCFLQIPLSPLQRNTPILCAMGTSGDRLKDHLSPQCCSSMYSVYAVQYQYGTWHNSGCEWRVSSLKSMILVVTRLAQASPRAGDTPPPPPPPPPSPNTAVTCVYSTHYYNHCLQDKPYDSVGVFPQVFSIEFLLVTESWMY